MPSWYTHMAVAKKAINELADNPSFAAAVGATGMSAAELQAIATGNPAYYALGSIGPDLFIFVTDFRGSAGQTIAQIATMLVDLYDALDPYVGDYQDIAENAAASGQTIANALTGGLLDTLSDTAGEISNVLVTWFENLVISQYDWWGVLSSGVQGAYDDQTLYWSDMLHYRKTSEFAANLWNQAGTDQERAYALGWMTHVGTDTVGHGYVNEKCGGPWRLHWQRHHVIESHIDAQLYSLDFADEPDYMSLCGAAQHLWIAFKPAAVDPTMSSLTSLFNPDETPGFTPPGRPGYNNSSLNNTADLVWDQDSDTMPPWLITQLIAALKQTYPAQGGLSTPKGLVADHPTILPQGYPAPADINQAYFLLYKYVKVTTSEFYNLRPPDPPPLVPVVQLPNSPPGIPSSDWSNDVAQDAWDIALLLFAWLEYLADMIAAAPAQAAAGVLGPLTYPARMAVYQYIELPLYNMWLAMHWYRAVTGYAIPLPGEISPALYQLGVGFGETLTTLQSELDSLSGGLLDPVGPVQTEPSGVRKEPGAYPHDAVTDPASAIGTIPSAVQSVLNSGTVFPSGEGFSEFLRPWTYPLTDMEGDSIPLELPKTIASPYRRGDTPSVLLSGPPGDPNVRSSLENSTDPVSTTRTVLGAVFDRSALLGSAVDYSSYLFGKLTTLATGASVANFNLDADRGYGFLGWDWTRDTVPAAPQAYKNNATPARSTHQYFAPMQAGSGWDQADLLNSNAPNAPTEHDPGDPSTVTNPVQIDYLS